MNIFKRKILYKKLQFSKFEVESLVNKKRIFKFLQKVGFVIDINLSELDKYNYYKIDDFSIYPIIAKNRVGEVKRFIQSKNTLIKVEDYIQVITPKIICVDFDATCVKGEFPKIGASIGAESVLKELSDLGHKIILWTVRSDRTREEFPGIIRTEGIQDVFGPFLTDAIDWFKKHKIGLYGINENPTQDWTSSPKPYAHFVIDDTNLGIPTKLDERGKKYVDWVKVRKILIKEQLLPK